MLAHATQRNGVFRGGLLVLFDGKYDSDLSRSGHHPRLCHGHNRHLGIECFRDAQALLDGLVGQFRTVRRNQQMSVHAYIHMAVEQT